MSSFSDIASNKIDKLNYNQIKFLFQKTQNDAQFLLSIYNSITQGLIVVDLDGRVLFVNKLATVICKKNISDGQFVWDVLPDVDFASDVKNAILNKTDFSFKKYIFTYRGKQEQQKIIKGALVPLVEKNKKAKKTDHKKVSSLKKPHTFSSDITGSIVCLEDVSDYTEKNRKKSRDKSFNSMRNITSGIAHELKNPLAAMSVHLQLLRRRIGQKQILTNGDLNRINSYIDIIEEEIDAMNNVVSIFLNDFKIPRSDLSPQNINDVVNAVCDLVGPELHKHKITVKRFLNKNLPKVRISRHAIMHALLNIIKNAKDAINENNNNTSKSQNTLRLMTSYVDGKVIVSITDTGRGVPKTMRKTIFDPYFTTKGSGNGIGLTIAYKIIRIHGGDILLDLSYTQGASFIISLPPYANANQLLT